jgi:hypothetical protein
MSEIDARLNSLPIAFPGGYDVVLNDSDDNGESDNIDIQFIGAQGQHYEAAVEAAFDDAHQTYRWGEGTTYRFYDNSEGLHRLLGGYRVDANGQAQAMSTSRGASPELESTLDKDWMRRCPERISVFTFPDGTAATMAMRQCGGAPDGPASDVLGAQLLLRPTDPNRETAEFASEGARFDVAGDPYPRVFATRDASGSALAWSAFPTAPTPPAKPPMDASLLRRIADFVDGWEGKRSGGP